MPAILDDPHNPFRVPPPPAGARTTGRRQALAEWITRPGNPLTARVIVNRIWAQHFGVGLVATVENFGRSGAPPTNQPLLDWLACSLQRGVEGSPSWTLKALHRLIVTSAAYRQSSQLRATPARIDPDNRMLWRQRPRRLEAENLRDAMLSVAGTLDARMYGESVAEEVRSTGEVVPSGEEKEGRRSIYLLVRRSLPVTLLNTFDAPVMETNCTRRITSTTATQALALLNSTFVDAQSRNFALRVRKAAETTAPAAATVPFTVQNSWIETAYKLALTRFPTPTERSTAHTFLQSQAALYLKAGQPKDAASAQALADLCLALLSSNEFAYLD